MLIPREQPYLQGLNSYYLQPEKFITHLQGEIGSGAVHCHSRSLEMLIFFSEAEIISARVRQERDPMPRAISFETASTLFCAGAHAVNVLLLDANALFFWAQMPSFHRG